MHDGNRRERGLQLLNLRSDEAAIYSQQAHGSGPYASGHGEILSMTDFQAQGSH